MPDSLGLLVLAIPLCPLLACLITLVLGPRVLRDKSHWPAILGCGLACAAALGALVSAGFVQQAARTYTLYQWIGVPGSATVPPVDITLGLRLDSLAATMLVMVTFVATLVAIYASGYMHGERGYWRFFTEVSLFVFSMIMLVLSGNFVQLYMFWEAVGLCSYLLIGFWYEKPSAAAAGQKAFLVNRVGDFGFAIGVFLIWKTFGTLNFDDVLVSSRVAEIAAANPAAIEWICFCLFTGAVGKSAQFPLHVWLPDAMEGPTPVSALIHAATMVTAGVYMVARCTPLFMHAPHAQLTISLIGGFTALLAAAIALTQHDLKRVLAYSTVSQLGFMFLALGTGTLIGIAGAMFHLVTHAFFKALLFLGAGSVMHAMGGVIDMRRFSGLKRLMPTTYWTFMIGSLALAGFPLLSGFWSKDTILTSLWQAGNPAAHAAAEHGGDGHDGEEHAAAEGAHPEGTTAAAETPRPIPEFLWIKASVWYVILFWVAAFTAFLTAFYTFRAVFLTFHGTERIPEEAGHHAHESPPVMTMPLVILAIGAAGLGLALGHPTGLFDRYLDLTIRGVGVHHAVDWFVVGVSTIVALGGIALAFVMYGSPSPLPAQIARAAGPLTRLSEQKFYIDQIYFLLLVLPARGLAQFCRFLDWILIDGLFVGFFSRVPRELGRVVRPLQNGLVQFYAMAMMLAMAVLLWALLSGPSLP